MSVRLVSKLILVFSFLNVGLGQSLQDRLNTFQTLSADIVETIDSEDDRQEMKGTLKIKRPQRFEWKLVQPDIQEIVSNGKQIWQYDMDLRQVIVRDIGQDLGGLPLLILSGDTVDIQTIFDIKVVDASTFELRPKSEDELVSMVRLRFQNELLSALDIYNTLGQEVHIVFSNVRYNLALDDDVFEFKIPEGVEIIPQ